MKAKYKAIDDEKLLGNKAVYHWASGILMSDSKLQGTEMKKCKASLLLYKAFLARSQGPSVSKTAPARRFEVWRPSFEVQKYCIRKYRRVALKKHCRWSQDCSVSDYDFENNGSRAW